MITYIFHFNRYKVERHFTESCGNIFADLGFENAEEMKAEADIVVRIIKILGERNLIQTQAAQYLGASQVNITGLNHADIDRFTFDKLIQWLMKLDQNIRMKITPKGRRDGYGSICVVG